MASGGLAVKSQHWDTTKSPKWIVNGVADIGRKETNDKEYLEENISRYCHSSIDVTDVPWCAFWLGYIIEEVGTPSTKSGMARSYLKWGIAVSEADWKEGDIVVFWRGRRNDGVTGHVAFLLTWDDDYVYCLGGNQGDKVCIQKFERTKILGVRRYKADWKIEEWTTVVTATGSGVATVVTKSTDTIVQHSDEAKTLLEQALSYFPDWHTALSAAVILFGILVIIKSIRKGRS